MVKVTAKQPFAHDGFRAAEGEQLEMNESMAAELERAGLVQIDSKKSPEPKNKMASEPKNKSA